MKRRTVLKSITGSVMLSPVTGLVNAINLRPRIKTSCNFFSFNQQITKGEMTTEEAIDFCAEIGFDGVDITGYYFAGYPQVPSDDYIFAVKNRVLRHGMRVSGTGVRNDFGQLDQDAVAADVQLVKDWIDVAVKLGAPMIRVFAGRKLGADQNKQEALVQIKNCLRSCIEYGRSRGVIVTYQNHNDILFTAAEVKELMEELADPWFGLNLDIGSLRQGDPYQEITQLAPYARNWQIKEYVYRAGKKEKVDLPKIGKIITEANYQGYVPLETLPPSEPTQVLPAFLDDLRRALSQ